MKVAQRFSAGKPAYNYDRVREVDDWKKRYHCWRFSAVRFADSENLPRFVPALKHWATLTQSTSRTRKIDFAAKPAWPQLLASSRPDEIKPLRFCEHQACGL